MNSQTRTALWLAVCSLVVSLVSGRAPGQEPAAKAKPKTEYHWIQRNYTKDVTEERETRASENEGEQWFLHKKPIERTKEAKQKLAMELESGATKWLAIVVDGEYRASMVVDKSNLEKLDKELGLFSKSSPAVDAVVKMIKERGGAVEVDRTQTDEPIVSVSLPGGDVTNADLKQLATLKNLKSLAFRAIVSKSPPRANGRITDAGLKELNELKNLESLDLAGHTQITDAGLKELKAFEKLRVLVLVHNNITDAGLKELAELKELRKLTIKFTNVTVTGISGLKELKSLKTLALGNNNVNFNYLKEVKAALPDIEIFEESYGR